MEEPVVKYYLANGPTKLIYTIQDQIPGISNSLAAKVADVLIEEVAAGIANGGSLGIVSQDGDGHVVVDILVLRRVINDMEGQ